MSEMVEEFRKIEDYGNYSVSNMGNVRNDNTGKILKPGLDKGDIYMLNWVKITNNLRVKFINL